MKKKLLILVPLSVLLFFNIFANAGTVIFEEPKEKDPQDKIIYDLIIHSKEWYAVKSIFKVKTYSKKAREQKEIDIKQGQKSLSLYIQKIADKYKVYFEDIVDIFNENDKKYILEIAGDEKNPKVIVKTKNV